MSNTNDGWLNEYNVLYQHLEDGQELSPEAGGSHDQFEYDVFHAPTGKSFVRRIAVWGGRRALLELLDNWNRVGAGTWVHWTRVGEKKFVLVEPGTPVDSHPGGGYSTNGVLGEVGVSWIRAFATKGADSPAFEALLPGSRSRGAAVQAFGTGFSWLDVVRVR
jgi:hypothetical protein